MFESSSIDDELETILNIARDEDIDFRIQRRRNDYGLPTIMRDDMRTVHNEICEISFFDFEADKIEFIKNIISRIEQLVDIAFVTNLAYGSTLETLDSLDVDNIRSVKLYILPRVGEFSYSKHGMNFNVFYSWEKRTVTLWTDRPPGNQYGADIKYHHDPSKPDKEILSLHFNNSCSFIVGSFAGDNISTMYKGLNIASIVHQFDEHINYQHKYIIELE